MKTNKFLKYIILVVVIIGAIIFFYFNQKSEASIKENNAELSAAEEVVKIPEFKKELVAIETGDTYSVVMERTNLGGAVSSQIYNAAKSVYDLANIKAGYNLELIYGYQNNDFQELIYKIDTEEELSVKLGTDGNFKAALRDIPYETKIVIKDGVITSSLYEAALKEGIDERAVIALADTFQWTIDFAMDPRVDDVFRFIYEERYLDGEYVRPGKILAGKYINAGERYALYYFEESADKSSYFDEAGNSVQKMFLKAPVAFKYISSGFTTGLRYVEAFNVSTGHRAIDYAAPSGTPIRSVGDGTITLAAWNGSYGNMVSVRHNGTYTTNYGHMSKIAVKKGAKVKQGDIIGYVGSTGFSTGPHLHYEMVKNGSKINPLAEILPPGEALSAEAKGRFLSAIKDWQIELDK